MKNLSRLLCVLVEERPRKERRRDERGVCSAWGMGRVWGQAPGLGALQPFLRKCGGQLPVPQCAARAACSLTHRILLTPLHFEKIHG